MPTNKDFKRLVRGRMQKTGESYTTARARLLQKKQGATGRPLSGTSRVPKGSARADYATLAGTSDAAIKEKTGCAWDRWVLALDYVEAHTWPHREIARYVHEKYKIPGWWAQTVTVGYERIKGLRERGQRRDGTYEASKSKTLPVPVRRLYRAFRDSRARARWLPNEDVTVRTATPDKHVRMTWADGTWVVVGFTRKGTGKSQVALTHQKLPSKQVAQQRKAYWEERLGALAQLLTPAARGT